MRAGQLAESLITPGQMEACAEPGFEPIALFEARARLGGPPALHQLASFIEERLGSDAISSRLRLASASRASRRGRLGEQDGAERQPASTGDTPESRTAIHRHYTLLHRAHAHDYLVLRK